MSSADRAPLSSAELLRLFFAAVYVVAPRLVGQAPLHPDPVASLTKDEADVLWRVLEGMLRESVP
jgi:hypothetical protein